MSKKRRDEEEINQIEHWLSTPSCCECLRKNAYIHAQDPYIMELGTKKEIKKLPFQWWCSECYEERALEVQVEGGFTC